MKRLQSKRACNFLQIFLIVTICLPVNIVSMCLHGTDADFQITRNLLGRVALGTSLHDFKLPGRQAKHVTHAGQVSP